MLTPTRVVRGLLWRLRLVLTFLARVGVRWRRWRALAGARLQALSSGADLVLEVDPSVVFGRGARIVVDPDCRSTLRIGAGTRVGEGALLRMKGGVAEIGPDCDIRRGVNISVAGTFVLGGDNVVSWGCVIHCDDEIRIGPHAMLAEYCTVVDSSHHYTEPDVAPHRNIRTAPVQLGVGVWLCPKVTVISGVTIGDHTIVAANSAVTKDLPGGWLVGGVPARPISELDLPWVGAGREAEAR